MFKHKFLSLASLVILLLTASVGSVLGKDESGLHVSVAAYSSDETQAHDKDAPLLLKVVVRDLNAIALSRKLLHEKHRIDAYRQTGFDKLLTEEQKGRLLSPTREISKTEKVRLGSETERFVDLISFRILNSAEIEQKLNPRLLKSFASTPSTITLDESNRGFLCFGLEPNELKALPSGKYAISAILKADSKIESQPLQITLVDNTDTNGRNSDYLSGRFYILDENFDKSGAIADKLLSSDNSSLAGVELKADSLAGQGKIKEAVNEFRRGLMLHRDLLAKKVKEGLPKNTVPEPPDYFLRRINEITAGER